MTAPFRFALIIMLAFTASCAWAEDFGPKSFPIGVLGVRLQVPVHGTYTAQPDGDSVHVTVTAHGDLASVQAHALDLARALRMPPAGCGHKALSATLTHVDSARIVADGALARIEISGDMAAAFCKKILGLQIVGTLEHQRVSMTAPVELYARDPHSVGLRLAGRAELKAQGPIGDAARDFEGNLNDLLTKRLQGALDSKAAHASLPALPGVDLTIDRASLEQQGDKLGVVTEAHGSINTLAFDAFKAFFAK
jgi:hypothetical protein